MLTCDDPAIRSVQVRALDNAFGAPAKHGCLGALIDVVLALLRLLFGNVLGVVKPTRVHFVAGTTGPVALSLVGARVAAVPVGVHTTEWRWQYRTGRGPWHELAVTRHRIYVLVDVPTAPWQQAPYSPSNTQLPWTEVLDVACRWGAPAATADQAAAKVTAAVYALGPGTVEYDCPGGGSSHYSSGGFACTAFLDRLHGGFGNGRYVNCSDCGTIVSAFANALGCDLWSSRMGYGFGLNELLAIGSSTWQTACGWGGFNYHEVAWNGACTAGDEVWDGCLRGRRRRRPGQRSARGPAARRHALRRPRRRQLPATAWPRRPHGRRAPPIRRRASGGPSREHRGGGLMSEQQRQFLEDQLALASAAPGDDDERDLVRGLPDLGDQLAGWRPVRTDARPDASPPSVLVFVRPADEAGDVVVAIDAFELPSAAAAHEHLARVLAEFQSPLLRVVAGVADVAVGHGDTAIVARRANVVFVVRNAGADIVAVLPVAQAVDAILQGGRPGPR